MHRELHEESLHLIEQALGNVKLLENRMRPEDYEDIIRRYGDMKVWVLLHQEEYEAYIRLLIQRKTPSERNQAMAEKSLVRLGKMAERIRSGEIKDCYLFSVDHVESFIEDCRRSLIRYR